MYEHMISLGDASRVTSLSRTMLNKLRGEGKFPQAVQLGERRIGFIRSEVEAWVSERIKASRKPAAAQAVQP